ncbi:hypothetical protein SAMN05421767_1384 [Granulicatella balaenopterae]|uniref:Nucleoid-associated protein SAMN05421767_1384 n=1 Tax=Granulicatella balaenopterae TaxID=137733 RepID=A0A1H9NDR3_9LACT|nr:YbaB/EbfC family nucleoid-associated protein [Granulicatella balaenopterae]SER34096.1 hypothetical protein SAMN05421767_1384 [Granulicatella balaenopterae]
MRGMGNMQGMMKQMQKMQKQMVDAQNALHEEEFVGKSQSDMVTVTVNGKREITNVAIKEEAVDPEDVELLQDLVMMAVNDALQQVEAKTESTMGQFTKGLNIPGF